MTPSLLFKSSLDNNGVGIIIGDVGQTNILVSLPAILSEVSPVIILENVKTAINAGPAKIWYSIPLPE